MIIFKSLCSKCWKGNSKNFLCISSFFDSGLCAMKRNYKSVWMKGYRSEWVSEHACGLLGCNSIPLILQGPRDAPRPAGSSLFAAMDIEPAATLSFWKDGPGFAEAQLRPELPSWLLKIWSSRNFPTELLETKGNRLWERDADLFWKISWLLVILWHRGPGHLPCLSDISLFYISSKRTKNPWKDHLFHLDICAHRHLKS